MPTPTAVTTEQYMEAVCAAGRAAQRGSASAELRALAELEQGAQCFLPAAHLRDAWGLTRAETLLLYVCIACLAEGKPLPGRAQAASLLAGFGQDFWQGTAGLFVPGADGGCLHPAAVDFLLQRTPRPWPGARLVLGTPDTLYHSQEVLERMERFVQALTRTQQPADTAAVVLCGPDGSGRRFLLEQLAVRQGFSLLLLETPDALSAADLEVYSRIYNALPCAVNARNAWPELAGLSLALYTAPEQGLEGPAPARTVLCCTVQPMTPADSVRAVEDRCGKDAAAVWAQAARVCRPAVGRLLAACGRAEAQALCGEKKESAFLQALREENGAALRTGAQKLTTGYRFADLVVSAPAERQLREICTFARVRGTVYGDWGFGHKSGAGRGITALFYGASGTGKTMAAGVVANELGLELYRVDLSQLISKYIGETQKNIGRIFDGASRGDCVLFFDEADALFARRSDASDAQDRYSNAEIAYLLQRTEQYDGIILLATNLLQNFDEAFRRRIGFMVHFTLPDESQRLRLWQAAFPPRTPVEGLDRELLAAQLELSGAGIRSCAVYAACLAAAAQAPVTMDLVVRAARREYEKEGKAFPPRLDAIYPQERSMQG